MIQIVLTVMTLLVVGGVVTNNINVNAQTSNNDNHEGWANQQVDNRPGFGFGDNNHIHTGPPGQTTVPERPGNGFGDDNHEHTGPPGKKGN